MFNETYQNIQAVKNSGLDYSGHYLLSNVGDEKEMTIKIAIVGCGAIAELGHLPALMEIQGVEVTAAIDVDLARAENLAARFAIPNVHTDYKSAAEYAEAVCVCLPPHLNLRVGKFLLEAKIHVLMEKPLAINARSCAELAYTAQFNERVLAVAMARRFTRAAHYLKNLVSSGMLGPIRRYIAHSGTADAWPARSSFNFDPGQSGGGVLMSNGCHDLDMMVWLAGPVDSFSFRSDSDCLCEANACFTGKLRNGGDAVLEISRTRKLSNTIRIEGENGVAIAPVMGESVTVVPNGFELVDLPRIDEPPLDYLGVMKRQLEDFVAAVQGKRAPLVAASSGTEIIRLIESCYSVRQELELPFNGQIVLPERTL